MIHEKINFTIEIIRSLRPQTSQYSISDSKIPTLRIMVYPSGVKTYMVCRKIKHKWHRIKIARASDLTIEQARKEAIRLNALIALGQNPHAEKRAARSEATFKSLYSYYYHQHVLNFTKRPKDNKSMVEFYVFPQFGNMPVSEITSEKLRRFHAQLAERKSKATANRILTLVATTYNFCIKNSFYKGINPCVAVRRFKTTSRDRFLSQEELQKFFEAVDKEEDLFKHFFLLLLYTGARKSNVLSIKWADIDFNLKQWRIPDTETKNKDINIVYICDPAIEILQRRFKENAEQENPSLYVFPGNGTQGFLNDPKRAFERIKNRMGISNFRIHDLRRTLGSYMAIGGASLPIIGKALNHKSQVSTAIYARLSQQPVLDAINHTVTRLQEKGTVSQFKLNTAILESQFKPVKFSALI